MNSLFTCHVVDWKKIPPNWIGGKLFPKKKNDKVYLQLSLEELSFNPLRIN